MTREEALERIEELANNPERPVDPGCVADARRLVGMLTPPALAALSREWIRTVDRRPEHIDLFWSKSAIFMTPGNRILTIETLGDGEFGVEVGDPFAIEWQRSADGRPVPDRLSLDLENAEGLLDRLTGWQLA